MRRLLISYFMSQITIGYALIAVINGVFLKETFSAAENDDKIMMRRAARISIRIYNSEKL